MLTHVLSVEAVRLSTFDRTLLFSKGVPILREAFSEGSFEVARNELAGFAGVIRDVDNCRL
jgi:hypothetical protein